MQYVVGIIAGLIYGCVIGALKYFLLWRKILKSDDSGKAVSMSGVTSRMFIGYAVNAATLISTLLIRSFESVDFAAFAIATAAALSVSGRAASIQKVLSETNIED